MFSKLKDVYSIIALCSALIGGTAATIGWSSSKESKAHAETVKQEIDSKIKALDAESIRNSTRFDDMRYELHDIHEDVRSMRQSIDWIQRVNYEKLSKHDPKLPPPPQKTKEIQ